MPQSDPRAAGRHLVLFDGACGLCATLVAFVLPRDRIGVFHFASMASPAGRSLMAQLELGADDQSTMHVIAHQATPHARHLTRARAALFVAETLGWPWKGLALFGVLPTGWLDRLYDMVARNRYRLFGGSERCLAPRSQWEERFVELREEGLVSSGG